MTSDALRRTSLIVCDVYETTHTVRTFAGSKPASSPSNVFAACKRQNNTFYSIAFGCLCVIITPNASSTICAAASAARVTLLSNDFLEAMPLRYPMSRCCEKNITLRALPRARAWMQKHSCLIILGSCSKPMTASFKILKQPRVQHRSRKSRS